VRTTVAKDELGPRALPSLGVAAGLLALVGVLAVAVSDRRATGTEAALTRWARNLPDLVADVLWPPMQLGTVDAAYVVAAIAALALGLGPGLRILVSVLLVAETSPALKRAIDRPRLTPDDLGAMPLEVVRSAAYPSSHAAVAFAVATAIALVHRRAGAVALVLALAVAIGRTVAGVHTVADLAGGAALGSAIAFAVHAAARALTSLVRRARS
jgi:undecaprenyl-diphosphatase